MSEQNQNGNNKIPLKPTTKVGWGETAADNFGYESDAERISKRGLEDWEMLEKMDESDNAIPYWFVAIFIVLLLVAVGLTFPFWGVRSGYERDWFDWGIVAGVAWCVAMAALIYYFVDYRYQHAEKVAKKDANNSPDNNSDKNTAVPKE
ncbi:MAG: hypothetical protein GXP10_08620 [Gammaproteobacteria bacterium]|nr:hypothetical protein [Gammaproteobacteria bacterium]